MKEVITHELAMSAARVLRDFCEQQEHCAGCSMKNEGMCSDDSTVYPYGWIISEREVKE